MVSSEQGPFEPAFRNSWLDVAIVVCITLAAPVVYAVYRVRRWFDGEE